MDTKKEESNGDGGAGAIPLWIDCDPGHDDALALILAGYSPEVNVIGVSTVAGNMPVDCTTKNALNVLHVAGLSHIPVVRGAEVPLLRDPRVCPEIHGDSGLDGHEFPPLPPSMKPLDGKAVNVMAERIMKHHSSTGVKVTVAALGCLTNLALMLRVYPEVQASIKEFVIMGGAIGAGNTHPVAEFNIHVDPEAAAIVFQSGIHVRMVPLEVTHTDALVTPEVFARIKALDSPFAELIINLLKFFADTYDTVFSMPDPPLHDPCAIAFVFRPEMFVSKECHVDIETSSPLCAGQTVVDLINIRKLDRWKNATVATRMDSKAYWDLMLDAITAANSVSVMNKAPSAEGVIAAASAGGGSDSAIGDPAGADADGAASAARAEEGGDGSHAAADGRPGGTKRQRSD